MFAAFNLLNNIDLPETERRIAAHAQANAALISANAEKLKLEALSQRERDELERKQREERQKAIREMEEFERAEEERIRGLVIQAMVSLPHIFPSLASVLIRPGRNVGRVGRRDPRATQGRQSCSSSGVQLYARRRRRCRRSSARDR